MRSDRVESAPELVRNWMKIRSIWMRNRCNRADFLFFLFVTFTRSAASIRCGCGASKVESVERFAAVNGQVDESGNFLALSVRFRRRWRTQKNRQKFQRNGKSSIPQFRPEASETDGAVGLRHVVRGHVFNEISECHHRTWKRPLKSTLHQQKCAMIAYFLARRSDAICCALPTPSLRNVKPPPFPPSLHPNKKKSENAPIVCRCDTGRIRHLAAVAPSPARWEVPLTNRPAPIGWFGQKKNLFNLILWNLNFWFFKNYLNQFLLAIFSHPTALPCRKIVFKNLKKWEKLGIFCFNSKNT